jgi:hypothetical protein
MTDTDPRTTSGRKPDPGETVTVYLNGAVRVTLRPPGERIWREYHADLRVPAPPWRAGESRELAVWELANVFGPHLYNGCDPPIECEADYRPPR